MKLKRILSSLLLAAIVFTSVVVAFPISASAAYSSAGSESNSTASANLSGEALTEYLESYLTYNYATPEEMLNDELAAGYLYSVNSADNLYTLYVNKYTGFVFYKNNLTGQILTSNPVDPGYKSSNGITPAIEEGERIRVMSQIELKFFNISNPGENYTYNSYNWSALRSQIKVSPISGGLRVSYTLGDTTPRFLLPGAITAERFDEYIITPMLTAYTEYLKSICEEHDPDYNYDYFDNENYEVYTEYGFINTSSASGLLKYIDETKAQCKEFYRVTSKEYKGLEKIDNAITKIVRNYYLENPLSYHEDDKDLKELYEEYPITQNGTAIYIYNTSDNGTADRREHGNYIKTYCSDYTFTMMYKDERECGYKDDSTQKPVFRCALEYSFNSDGTLSISLPASSITFDETVYALEYINPVQFFGCADASRDGYVFYPDGSGTIVEFEDFYREGNLGKPRVSYTSNIFGKDYCYSTVTGQHRQQVTMPVYGVVTETNANQTTKNIYGKDTVTNGYLAILEEGASLATLGLNIGGTVYKYGRVYASYTPYPQDTFDLSETISSVGALGFYTMVSESKYTGSYVTRIVMLTDEEIGNETYGKDAYYESSYVGMAAYYRNYLKENGTLSALQLVSEDLPLYIEAFGAMDITAKFLSFPVTKTIPLTSFDDVISMYNSFADVSAARDAALKKAAETDLLAEAETDADRKAEYVQLAKDYREFAAAIENISNVNFRLTGFSNGGMKYTYPTKVKWERACGGADGYKNLLSVAEATSLKEGVNFGVYPDFDFMYITNTAMFDGISNRNTVSKMVDGRYASMQMYNSTLREYESVFDLVISADALDRLYTKFEKSFSETATNKISVSTLGSELNSNFDEDNPINREGAKEYVEALLNRMTAENGYELMTDIGNIYSVKYATHILNMPTDSSHFRYSSYAIPFTGIVLHSYVNYTGTPFNYSGNVEYEILKSIEMGAAPYYILCYQNSANLKEDEELNQYYGVSYENWYEDILETYAKINAAIGGLQDYEITDHRIIVCERIIEDEEMAVNYVLLENEIVELLDAQLSAAIDAAFAELQAGGAANYDKRVKLVVDREKLLLQFSEILNLPVSELEGSAFVASVDKLISEYSLEYPGSENNSYEVKFDSIEYSSKYSYITDSSAFDKDYVRTDYTIDNGNVTMVTYQKGDVKVNFLVNYNNFSVDVRLDADTVITLDKFSFEKIG